jgi:alcohol dehydrogenase (cytochrome c)
MIEHKTASLKLLPNFTNIARVLAFLSGLFISNLSYGQAAGSWTTPAGVLQGTRYSALTDMTSANIGSLVEEFSYPTGAKASHQGGPLVVGGVMYVVTPFPNKLIALDLTRPGTALWTFDPHANGYARGVACCDVVNRGASYASPAVSGSANGLIVYNLLDGNTIAVDAKLGKQVWRTKLADPTSGETLTGAPIVVNGNVIVGDAGAELGVRGWVQALDVKTGKVKWKAYNTGPDSDMLIDAGFKPFYAKDQGANLGTATWQGTQWKQGGATAWAWLTYDPSLNLLYYGSAQPGVWNPDMRPGDNKWSSTIFARNPDTGKAVWAYQLTPHDGWDFDAVNESIVADLPIGGVTRKVIVHFNKNGFAYTIDRATGQVLVAKPFGNVTWATDVNLSTGLPSLVPAMQPHQGIVTSGICPSPLGVKDWEPSAYSPATQLFYIPAINFCDNLEPMKAMYIAGTPFMGADVTFTPGPGGYLGELVAWNAATGQRAWSVHETLPLYAGVLATAGNLVFYGTLSGQFKAVDAMTGAVVFQKQLECGIVSNPMTYTAPDGKQRVAVMTGVGWLAGGFAGGTCPAGTVFGGDGLTPLGRALAKMTDAKAKPAAGATSGYIHVFKLP